MGEIIVSENDTSQDTQGSWNYDPATNNWKFELINADGSKITYKDQWIRTKNAQGESTWFTVDKEGKMITGWKQVQGDWYFFQTDGAMLSNTTTPDGYLLGADGKMLPTA